MAERSGYSRVKTTDERTNDVASPIKKNVKSNAGDGDETIELISKHGATEPKATASHDKTDTVENNYNVSKPNTSRRLDELSVENETKSTLIINHGSFTMNFYSDYVPNIALTILGSRTRERMNTNLLTAVYDCKPIDDLKKLLDRGADVKTTCRDSGASVLHVAALNSHPDVVKFLMSVGADVTARDNFGKQAVHVAAWEGNLQVLQELCRVDPSVISSKVLVEAEHSIQYPDSWNHAHDQMNKYWKEMEVISSGSTPLHISCSRIKESCVKFLLEQGVDTFQEDSKGLNPVDVIGIHVKEGWNRESADSTEGSIVGIAKLLISHQTPDLTAKVGIKVRRLLSLEEHDVRPTTALHTAVSENNLNLISILLDEQKDVLIWNEDSETPLHLSVKKKFLDALCLMLRHGDNRELQVVNAVDSRNRTLLHLAVAEEWTDGVSVLLEENADVTSKDDQGQTVLHIAAKIGNFKILTELLTVSQSSEVLNDVDTNDYAPIHHAVENKHLKCLELLVRKGAKPDVLLPDGRTLLHMVAKNDARDELRYLMDVNEIKKFKEKKTSEKVGGMTALHVAACCGFNDIVTSLLEFKCDILATTENTAGSTPLHLAAKFDRPQVVKTILNDDKTGSTLQAKDKEGWYPLHVAAGHGHEECIDIMLRCGADIALVVHDEHKTEFTALDIIMTCVHRPVDFLDRILDSYIVVDGTVPVTDPQYKIAVNFDFLLPKSADGKQLGVLEAVLNNGSDDLEEAVFLHPIVQIFIHLKSQNMVIFFVLFFSLFFMLALYLNVIAFHSPLSLRKPDYQPHILLGLLSINVFSEIVNVARLKRYYLRDAETWIKWFVYLNILFILMHPTDQVLRYNMAFSILASWIELLLITAKYPAWGIYVLMFLTVAETILKVLAVFSLLLVGFAFTFRVLFQEQGPFHSVWSSTVEVLIMVYELDYRSTMEEMKKEGESFENIARIFYLIFVLTVCLCLVNLMLGLAVNDIAELRRKGRAKHLAKQVAFLGGIENLACNCPLILQSWCKKYSTVPSKIEMKPGSHLANAKKSPVPKKLNELIIDKVRSIQMSNDESLWRAARKSLSLPTNKLLVK